MTNPTKPENPASTAQPSKSDVAHADKTAVGIPPEAGHRAVIDRNTGEVHGSGSGAGGGNPGEDYDDGTPGGS